MQSGHAAAALTAQSAQHALPSLQFGHEKVVFGCVQAALSAQQAFVQSASHDFILQSVFSQVLASQFAESAHCDVAHVLPSQSRVWVDEQPTMSAESATMLKSAIFFILMNSIVRSGLVNARSISDKGVYYFIFWIQKQVGFRIQSKSGLRAFVRARRCSSLHLATAS